ncbi:uncharacterized protein STEHIDRAFT_72737 [Stereum hirsutum FP-91666 SS1]|uniref:uncharacterized protein n=1 Tax=Stereum hirsutum (strain FP-91666) TaxID=721885 RepID=UPI000440FC1B|nr:uncharacterized protein STEHIDRAFT_72737 [Stereum hirsutum FP-91666 SS1]EIM91026.1 hypothetical protein STEHIDRAFT_72737 [Stereum hirsutum FP-91666 SS1]
MTSRRAELDEIFGTLHPYEIPWRDRQLFLQSRGYMLRPRLRPGWQPSWRIPGNTTPIGLCEDSCCLSGRKPCVDATRISDGELVFIKRVKTDDDESRIALYLSDNTFRQDTQNHCVPIIDYFEDSDDPSISYLVMPFLSSIDGPPFETVGDVVEFCDQILEGFVFLHERGVAHRDCASNNLMMDASRMYPKGHHPLHESFLPSFEDWAPIIARSAAHVKYYFVDFGISSSFSPSDTEPKLVLGEDGIDQEVSELSDTVPYDPFKVDVFIMGNVFRRNFYDVFSNVGFLKPLFEPMIRADPSSRLPAEQALALWKEIRPHIYSVHKSWRLHRRDEFIGDTFLLDSFSFVKSGYDTVKSIVGW